MILLVKNITTKVILKIVKKMVYKQEIDIVSTTTFHPSYGKKMTQLSGLRWLILKITVS